jgi:Bacterial SH3 domain
MKARILDPQVKVYGTIEDNAVSIATLTAGSEIEFGAAKRKAGKMWVPIVMSTGQQAYIPGDTRLYLIREGSLLQDNVELHAEPMPESPVKRQFTRNEKISVLEVVKGDGGDWVRVRDVNGGEGFINGNTRIRLIQQRTKAMGRKNMLTGAMWLIAGLLLTFSSSSSGSSGFSLFGYGAILLGAVMLISGAVQYFTAPT